MRFSAPLVSDLARRPTVAPEAGDATAASNARFVISGSYQLIDNDQLRLVGEVFDKSRTATSPA
jgi:hypothetical protein